MSTAALQSVWEGLMAYNLTPANKRWLADKLWKDADRSYSYETWEDVPMSLRKQIEDSRAEITHGESVVCHTKEEMQQFFDSL